jgi:predicted O-methyltransferase YrrM
VLTVDAIRLTPADFDALDFCQQDDPLVQAIGAERLRDIYRVKYQVARAVRPRSVLEIGVGAGHAAAAFLAACPRARYVGLDLDERSREGVCGSLADVAAVLRGRFPLAQVCVHPWDTIREETGPRLRRWYGPTFDLAHVDGDRTEEGCLSDLALAAGLVRPGGCLLVADCDRLPEVRAAVERFLQGTGHPALALPSPHGDLLIQLGG